MHILAPLCLIIGVVTIDPSVHQAVTAAHVEGASVEVIKDGTVIYVGGIGKRDVAHGLPADAATQYEIGSITKQFTAAAILQLEEAQKLQLDARLSTYLPAVPHAKEVTIRQLLTMTSGMPNYLAGDNIGALAATPATFDDLMSRIAGRPLDFTPGTQFGASNTNYLILGRVVEVLSGQSWGDYAKTHLFTPADMTQSSRMAYESRLSEMALGYATVGGKTTTSHPIDASWASGAGDVVTTVGDLAKWDAALASGKIVSHQSYELMMTPQIRADGSTNYGMGAYVDSSDESPRVLTQGDTFGFDASDVWYPREALRIIVLTNTANDTVGASTSTEIADSIYDAMLPPVSGSASATALYAAAVRAMDYVQQPAYVSYRLEGSSDNIHIGLETANHQVWLLFQRGSSPTTWVVQHRTEDYASEVQSASQRYVSQRSLFDPTWFGAFRALRDGMLGYQNTDAPRTALAIAIATPSPDPKLNTIATVNAIGTGIYAVQDRGAAACANGDPGHALHLIARRRDRRHQLTDVIVDLRSTRFCMIRFGWSEQLWFDGVVEQNYAEVGGYWMETSGSIDGKVKLLGIPTNRFVWQYRLSNLTFPAHIDDSTFVPDPSQ